MELDLLSDVPRYRQIAAILKERIERGQYQPHQPIPSLVQLKQEFGTATGTNQKAVGVLKDEGLVVAVPGVGTLVTER